MVGHSSGAHLAVSILSDLLRQGLPERAPALSLLTLGQVVPMVSFLPKARRLRADLAYLSAQAQITWVDVTAPGEAAPLRSAIRSPSPAWRPRTNSGPW